MVLIHEYLFMHFCLCGDVHTSETSDCNIHDGLCKGSHFMVSIHCIIHGNPGTMVISNDHIKYCSVWWNPKKKVYPHVDGLIQDCGNFNAIALS